MIAHRVRCVHAPQDEIMPDGSRVVHRASRQAAGRVSVVNADVRWRERLCRSARCVSRNVVVSVIVSVMGVQW